MWKIRVAVWLCDSEESTLLVIRAVQKKSFNRVPAWRLKLKRRFSR